jgi:hypothetical protein
VHDEARPFESEVAVVHLVWAPLGVEQLRRFVESYAAHPAGQAHRLIIVYNGFAPDSTMDQWHEALTDVRHDDLLLASRMLDLAAYREAIVASDAEVYCFLNSYSEPLSADWLRLLIGHLNDPTIATVGASGSYESIYTTSHPLTRVRKRGFPEFPNPHLRTNAFAARREQLMRIQWPTITSKMDALRFESGPQSLTRQLQRFGRAVVAGRDGCAYDVGAWRESNTFRWGNEANLLVSDNRTREYLAASEAQREDLERRAWRAR